MQEPYSEATYKQKIEETLIPQDVVDTLDRYLVAIAHFYSIIEIDHAWTIIKKMSGMRRSDFDALIPIFARNADAEYTIQPESDYYEDGHHDLLVTDYDAFVIFKGDRDLSDEELETIDESNFLDLFEFDIDAWARLDAERLHKPMYIPSDLLSYCDLNYVEETPYVAELRHFLEEEADFDAEKSLPDPEEDVNDKDYRKNTANECLVTIVNEVVRGPIPFGEIFNKIFEVLDDFGFEVKDDVQAENLAKVLSGVINNTRLPANRGYTAKEIGEMEKQA